MYQEGAGYREQELFDIALMHHVPKTGGRVLPLSATGEELAAPPEFMLVMSYNPGYQNLLKGMKPSTRQRFVALRFDYPAPAVEEEILIAEARIEPALAQRLVALGTALRALEGYDLEEAPSTRLLIHAGRLIAAGEPPLSACRAALVEALTDEPETASGLLEIVRASFGE